MKKLVPLIVVGFLILSGFGAVGLQIKTTNSENNEINENSAWKSTDYTTTSYSDSIVLSQAQIVPKGNFVQVELEEATSNIYQTGKPIIPVVTKTFTAPAGSRLMNSDISIDWETINLNKDIKPAEIALPMTTDNVVMRSQKPTLDTSIYSSGELFPDEAYTVTTGSGIKDGEHVLYINVRCNAQYSPANNYIKVPKEIEIDLNVKEPIFPLFNQEKYDLLIITHDKFKDKMDELASHKNGLGISTKVTTVDQIYPLYNGAGDWEEVKMYLADKVKQWGVDYVLFAGGKKGQTNEWYVPTFESNNRDDAFSGTGVEYDPTYSCDLYFADVYYADQYGFLQMDDWDSNGNGIPAEGPLSGNPDIPDYYPDVYFGRIPLRYSWEADIVVDKIKYYDNNGNPNFYKAILCGGDTSPPARDTGGNIIDGIYEGELAASVTGNYLSSEGFQITKLFTSTNGDIVVREPDDVTPIISQGAGWVNMQTHSNPAVAGNFWPDGQTEDDFAYFVTIFDYRSYTNSNSYPFLVLDGCHSAQFNVGFQQVIDAGSLNYPRGHFLEYSPTDVSTWSLMEGGGGSIGAIGASALGYGYINNGITQGLGGWLMPRFAHAFAVQNQERIGELWAQGITDYINIIGYINEDEIDRKTIEERAILGDPTVRLHGGSMSMKSSTEEESTPEYLPTASLPTWSTGQTWTYNIKNIDYSIHEVEGRDMDIGITAGNLVMEVTDVTSDSYIAEYTIDSVDGFFDINVDPYTGEEPIVVSFEFPPEVAISGTLTIEKSTMAIAGLTMNFDIELDTDDLFDSLNINLPRLLTKILFPSSRLPVSANIEFDFDDPFTFIKFPLDVDDSWEIEEAQITIDGTIESNYFRVLKIVYNILKALGIQILPAEIGDQLPVIDIGDFLDDAGVPDELDIPQMTEFFRKPPFEVERQESVNVPAGSFNCYNIETVQGVAELFYNSQVENFVKIEGNLGDFTPIVDDIEMELISYS